MRRDNEQIAKAAYDAEYEEERRELFKAIAEICAPAEVYHFDNELTDAERAIYEERDNVA